jgi:beta-lactamase regulating signal transducer with metallopeptidase domain
MEALVQYLYADPALTWLLTLLLKSLFVLSVTALLAVSLRRFLPSTIAHLIWLCGLVITASLPLFELLSSIATQSASGLSRITLITVNPENLTAQPHAAGELLSNTFLLIYVAIVLAGLASLAYAYWRLRELDTSSTTLDNSELTSVCLALCKQLGIAKQVTLKSSALISSPVSYGVSQPVILLPAAASHWPEAIVEQVLTHELAHIARADWLTLLFSKGLCALLWANPLVWLASKNLHDESEQACDAIVAALNNNRTQYAENLLMLAKHHKRNTGNHWRTALAQPMYGKHPLAVRITNILEGKLLARISRTTKTVAAITVLILSAGFSGVQLLAADSGLNDQDYLPVRAVSPMYPTRAAEEGIEGWLLLGFTVKADGTVDANSLQIIDAEPAGYFENNSRSAALQFEFEPRIVDGLAVDVPGVQYLFRYVLSNEEAPDFSRPPPPARR